MMLDSHVLMKEDEAEMGVQSEGCGDGLWGERVAILGWLPGAGGGAGVGSWCLIGTESQSGKMRKFWRWRWWRLHNSVNVPNATELCTYKRLKWSMLCTFYHNRHLYQLLLCFPTFCSSVVLWTNLSWECLKYYYLGPFTENFKLSD